MTPDWLLLRRYAQEDSQEAFAALTARYLNLVYAVCLREIHDPELAQDATQAVFLLLARTAPSFRSRTALPGWLFRTARFTAQNARTGELRRKHYEEKAAQAMQQTEGNEDAARSEIEPLLNQSLASLKPLERDCILLRFFQQQSFAELGDALGLSEEAARKRVSRSLEKMQRFLTKEGVVIAGTGLASLLLSRAAESAPAPAALAVAQLTAGVIPVSVSLLLKGTLHAMKIARLKTAGAVTVALLVIAAYPVLTHARGTRITRPATRHRVLAAPPSTPLAAFPKNAVLSGRVIFANGRPAPGVSVVVGLQERAESALTMKTPEADWGKISAISGAGTVTKADGSYRFTVAPNLPYNVLVDMAPPPAEDDRNARWVAAGNQGAIGQADKTTTLSDLVLVKGTFVTGHVTDKATHQPVPGVYVGFHGPSRPDSTGMITQTKTDAAGAYRLRVIPGRNRVYVADGRYNGLPNEEAKAKGLMKTLTVRAGEPATMNFAVTDAKKP